MKTSSEARPLIPPIQNLEPEISRCHRSNRSITYYTDGFSQVDVDLTAIGWHEADQRCPIGSVSTEFRNAGPREESLVRASGRSSNTTRITSSRRIDASSSSSDRSTDCR